MKLRKFLGIAFLCHQRADRSFFYRGRQFPLCARCTGILIGYILGITLAILTHAKHHSYFLILLIPMIIDGGIQKLFALESTNLRRLLTGILGGVGIVYLLITIHLYTFAMAGALARYLHSL